MPRGYELRLPTSPELPQDEEWCEVDVDGKNHRIRLHDYAQIYRMPGLYERLFRDELCCDSPRMVASLLQDVLKERRCEPRRLRVLEVGAGNGMVGEQLARLGVSELVGVDILPEAADAARRDRPGLYDAYYVVDVTDPPVAVRQSLAARDFNCVVAVGALGFADLSPPAFAAVLSYLGTRGLAVFDIKEQFLSDTDQSGFARLMTGAVATGALRPLAGRRYQHRWTVNRRPLHYQSFVAEKLRELPPEGLGG